jgi:probable phosphoglycerate mutase
MLLLARHGECAANLERRYVGRSESPLTPRGERQAARLAAAIAADPSLRIERIVSSPLGRARFTAEAIVAALPRAEGGELTVELDERFAELDYGEIDGEAIAAVGGHGEGWLADSSIPAPGGESIDEVAGRVFTACTELRGWLERAPEGAATLVVSHVVPVKLAVCWALGVAPVTMWRMNLAVASLTRIAVGGGAPRLERYNEHAFLGEDRSPPIWR